MTKINFEYQEKNQKGNISEDWEIKKTDDNKNKIGDCHSYELKGLKMKGKPKGKQSPININSKSVHDCNLMCNLSINYKPSKCIITKDTQDIIIIDGDENSSISFNNKKLPLQKIYFHTPSHHLIDGNSSTMEINLYHSISKEFLPQGKGFETETSEEEMDQHADIDKGSSNENYINNKGVIISILVKEVKDHIATPANQLISQFITNHKFRKLERNQTQEIEVSEDWNIKDLLPNNKSFFTYEGSLPMPPCYETFNWIVFEHQIEVMKNYIEIMKQEGNPNGYRTPHPLNNRIVFYNNNVEITEEEVPEETKADMINKMLAPIRITTDSRSGVEYRLGARQIVDSYMGGANGNYNDDEQQLENLSNGWDQLGKAGEQELTLEEIMNLKEKDKQKYIDYVTNMVFDAKRYYIYNYLDTYLSNTFKTTEDNNSKKQSLEVEEDYSETLKLACSELSILNSDMTFFKEENKDDTYKATYTHQQILTSIDKIKGVNIDKFVNLQEEDERKTLLLLYLLSWYMDTYQNDEFVNLLDMIESNEEKYEIHNFILTQLYEEKENLKEDNKTNKTNINNLIFKFQGEDLIFTLEGDECQNWGSNEVHYEGSLLKLFNKNQVLDKSGYKFDDMNSDLKKLARDGLLNKSIDGKWKPHNKCRDPEGTKGAPWCYTKNPKERWGYCMVPDRVGNSKKYLLFVIFIMIIVLAIYLVKLIFRLELFSQFIAKLTGAEFASNAVFKANQVANTIKNNLKG